MRVLMTIHTAPLHLVDSAPSGPEKYPTRREPTWIVEPFCFWLLQQVIQASYYILGVEMG